MGFLLESSTFTSPFFRRFSLIDTLHFYWPFPVYYFARSFRISGSVFPCRWHSGFYRPLIDFKFIQFPSVIIPPNHFPKSSSAFFSIKITFLRFFVLPRGGKAGCREGISMRLFINLLVNINFARTFKPRKRFCFVFAHPRTQLSRRQIYTFQTRLTRRHDWRRRIKFMGKIFQLSPEKKK